MERALELCATGRKFFPWVSQIRLKLAALRISVPDAKKCTCPRPDRSMSMELALERVSHQCSRCIIRWRSFCHLRFITTSLRSSDSKLRGSVVASITSNPRAMSSTLKIASKALKWKKSLSRAREPQHLWQSTLARSLILAATNWQRKEPQLVQRVRTTTLYHLRVPTAAVMEARRTIGRRIKSDSFCLSNYGSLSLSRSSTTFTYQTKNLLS